MRPAKLVCVPATQLPKALESLPVWQGEPTTAEGAADYLLSRSQKSHRGLSEERDRVALTTLVQEAVGRLNLSAPQQPPIYQVSIQWGAIEPLSGLRFIELVFVDTQERCHDKTWAADEWCTASGSPDRGLGQWPLDNRTRRLGGGWEHWLRTLAGGLSFDSPLLIPIASPLLWVDPKPVHQDEEKRPTSQRKRTGPR